MLASKLAKKNPLVSPQSSGVLNVTVINCTRLPAGSLLNVASDPTTKEVNDGTATFQASATGIGLGGTLFDKISSVLPNLNQYTSVDLQPSNYTFAKGELTQKSTLSSAALGVITLNGGIKLADLSYDNFTVTLPSKALGNYSALASIAAIPVGGTLAHPTIDANVLKSTLTNLTKNPAPPPSCHRAIDWREKRPTTAPLRFPHLPTRLRQRLAATATTTHPRQRRPGHRQPLRREQEEEG